MKKFRDIATVAIASYIILREINIIPRPSEAVLLAAKVRALDAGGLDSFASTFFSTARNQMVGIGMHVANGKVTVMSLQSLSFFGHSLLRVHAKNLLGFSGM